MKAIIQLINKDYLPKSSVRSVHGPGCCSSAPDPAEVDSFPSPARRTWSRAHRLSEISKNGGSVDIIISLLPSGKVQLQSTERRPAAPPHNPIQRHIMVDGNDVHETCRMVLKTTAHRQRSTVVSGTTPSGCTQRAPTGYKNTRPGLPVRV
jgi:hypothetical protein